MANWFNTQQRLRSALTTRAGIVIGFVIIAVTFMMYVGWLAYGDLQRDKQAAREKVAVGAIALEENASRAFGEVTLLLESFSDICGMEQDDFSKEALEQRIEETVDRLPQLAGIALYSVDGGTLHPSRYAPAPEEARHGFSPAHFDPFDGDAHRNRIGNPFQSSSGESPLIPFSVRVSGTSGVPCAVAVASVRSDYFEGFFRTFLGSDEGVVLLRRQPQGLLVRVPPPPASTNRGYAPCSPDDTSPECQEPGPFGVQRVTSPVDGSVRIAAYRKSEQFPLGVRFALTEQAITAQWLSNTIQATFPGLGVLALLLGSTLWIDHLLRLGRRRQQALGEANQGLLEARRDADAANAAKSRFLANMSHELRTPLNTIVVIGELFRTTSMDDRQRGYADKLETASSNMLTLIDDVLDLSKAETDRLELEHTDFDLAALLREITDMTVITARDKDLAVHLAMDSALPAVLTGDPARLRQVLVNLTGNAIKFTDKGEIAISADIVAADTRSVTICLAVRDTGIGMTEEQMTGIFGVFSQADASTSRRFGGTGLGLAISQRIAQAMGTRILVESTPGEGSRFSLTLTLPCEMQPSITAPAIMPSTDALEGFRVLLVDDDPLGRTVNKELLEALGASVHQAVTGREAVAACLAAERIDVILMDMRTPDIGGLEATRRIRSGPAWETPIIGFSANALEDEIQRALAAGMDDYLSKPVDVHRLVVALKCHARP